MERSIPLDSPAPPVCPPSVVNLVHRMRTRPFTHLDGTAVSREREREGKVVNASCGSSSYAASAASLRSL